MSDQRKCAGCGDSIPAPEVRYRDDIWHGECVGLDSHERALTTMSEIVGAVGLDPVDLRAVRNRYGSRLRMGPWFEIECRAGVLTIGWRGLVIQISWTREDVDGRVVFADLDVTVGQGHVHAWSVDDAKAYLRRLALVVAKPTSEETELIVRTLWPAVRWDNIIPRKGPS